MLPPAFASIFDDFASSSLDAFFDPSSGLLNFPGLTMGIFSLCAFVCAAYMVMHLCSDVSVFELGTFKLLSKCIDGKGFSGTKRYFGDLGKTVRFIDFILICCSHLLYLQVECHNDFILQLKMAGSNIIFATITEISDSVLKGAETNGFNGMVKFILDYVILSCKTTNMKWILY